MEGGRGGGGGARVQEEMKRSGSRIQPENRNRSIKRQPAVQRAVVIVAPVFALDLLRNINVRREEEHSHSQIKHNKA